MASIISASTTSATALNLSGDTTGILQLATGATPTTAVTIDASQNVTFVKAINKSALPTGSVLQVVQGTLTTTVSTSSSSFVTTGLTASITPLSSSNKILIIVNGTGDTLVLGQQIVSTIYRSSTNLASSTNAFTNNYGQSSRVIANMGMSYLDSPSTTSSTTYTAYFASETGGTVTFNQSPSIGTSVATITLMEIAA